MIVAAALALAAVTVGTLTSIEFESPRAADESVTLPDEPTEPARLSDEQRAALESFEPDRLRCDPAGCEVWRLRFDEEPARLAVGNGWLAAIDGSVLRLRHIAGDVEVARDEPARDESARDEPSRGTSALDEAAGLTQVATNEPTGGPTWGPTPPADPDPSDPGASDPDGARDHDLAGRIPALAWHDDDDGAGYLDVAASPPEQLAVLPDGQVVLRWFDRVLLLDVDGAPRWELTSDERTFRYVAVVDDLLLVLRDDLPWPHGTTGPRPTGDPILASVHDLHDGGERWQRYTLSPRDVMEGGLLITTVDGGIEMVDLEAGTTRWRRPLEPNERIQSSTGPWVVLTGPRSATLLDARSGREAAVREGAALLTPLQRIGDLWVAAWLDGGLMDASTQAAVVALDAEGEERWRSPIAGLGRGACCPAAIPWADGTIAVHDPASPVAPWRTVDQMTGTSVELVDELRPRLPLGTDDPTRVYASSLALDRIVQEQDGRLGMLTAEGHVRVQGASNLEVVALDPLVIRQGREVMGVRPVPLARSDPPS